MNWFSLLVLSGALALVAWVVAATHYTVTDEELIVQSGPVRRHVRGQAIERVRAVRTLLGAQALSMDRIEVSGSFGAVVISPKDKSGFIQALRRIAPHVRDEVPLASGRPTSV